MTKAEFYVIAEEGVNETLLHASYSIKPKQYDAVQFAMRAMLMGLRARLDLPGPSKEG